MDTNACRQALNDAVAASDAEAFTTRYLQYLSRFDAFNRVLSVMPASIDVINPIFGTHSFYMKQTTDEEAASIMQKSMRAGAVFAGLSLPERLRFLALLKSKIDALEEDIILTITADTGKPLALSKGEMAKGNEWFQFAAEEAENQLHSVTQGRLTRMCRPLGVAQVIGAYNYPYALAIGGIVGALAAGNAVVVSAPLKAPSWVFPFMQAAERAIGEFNPALSGLIQISVGINHKLTAMVDIVHFVGSDIAGEHLHRRRGARKIIREMGGSNMVVVMKSALEKMTAEHIAATIYGGFGPATGQRCTAPRMLCLQDGAEEVARLLKDMCKNPQGIGNPFDAATAIGPLVDKGARQKMREAIQLAAELKAEVSGQMEVAGRIITQESAKSFWVGPVIIDWGSAVTDERVRICLKEEIFGPLLHIVRPVKTLNEAIDMTNLLDNHGLAGAIFTGNEADVAHYQQATRITSLVKNGAPKDQSPRGEHGHPGLPKIGGPDHFTLYSDRYVRADMA